MFTLVVCAYNHSASGTTSRRARLGRPLAAGVMYLIYSLLFTLGFFLALPYYVLRRGGGGALRGIRERFGRMPESFRQQTPGAILVHAVSLGETLALVPLVQELECRYPDRRIFLSHQTLTGRQAGRERLPTIAGQFYLPLDWRWSMRRMVRHLQPELVLIGETELWPNFFRAVKEAGSKLVVVNARVSDRSFPRYRLGRVFFRRVLEDVDIILAQSPAQKERFLSLGASTKQVVVTGNMKFEFSPPAGNEFTQRLDARLREAGFSPVMIAASTMPGEEEKVLCAWSEIRRHHARGLLILAPRHPERFDTVAGLLKSRGVNFVRRSHLGDVVDGSIREDWSGVEAILLDTLGELGGLFELSTLAYVGGSLVSTGGHNLLEPAYWAKPVLFGPHMENFSDMADMFVSAGAAIRVPSEHALAREVLTLLRDSERARRMGEAARRLLDEHRGATARNLSHIEELLKVGTPECQMAVQST